MQGGQPLVHRDIKPSNVLLSDQLEAIICDFGSLYVSTINDSRVDGLINVQGTLDEDFHEIENEDKNVDTNYQGTNLYSPREAFSRNRPSTKWDVFSFGVIMYELLTGLPVKVVPRPPIPGFKKPPHGYLVEHLLEISDDITEDLINNILDQNTHWNINLAIKIYNFALQCTNLDDKDARPDIQKFIDVFENE